MEIFTVAQSQESQEDNPKDCKMTHLEIVKPVKEASAIKLSVLDYYSIFLLAVECETKIKV